MKVAKAVRVVRVVKAEKGGAVLGPENYRRYAPFVGFASAVDTDRLVGAYVRFYPLFQEAYETMGYPEGYFNDRLVEVIDHLLVAPEIEGPVRLVQPRVRYQFADPELESLSAGHKILVRMGPENARRLKGKLGEVREALLFLPEEN